jgi:adenylate cyclase
MTTRRLAAILAADVVGFSSMMERDEEGTAARIRKQHCASCKGLCAGRSQNSAGAGFTTAA